MPQQPLIIAAPDFVHEFMDESPIRCLAYAPKSGILATGDGNGQLRFYDGEDFLFDVDCRPDTNKGRNELTLRLLSFCPSGDLLYCANGNEIVAVSVQSGQVFWTFKRNKLFALLLSTPLGLAAIDDYHVVASFSCGQMVVLDRQGRVIRRHFENDAPQSMVYMERNDLIVGVDGFKTLTWRSHDLGTSKPEIVYEGRAYSVAGHRKGTRFAIRIPGGFNVFDTTNPDWTMTIPCGAGLPHALVSEDGTWLVHTEENALIAHNLNNRYTEKLRFDDVPTSLIQGEDSNTIIAGFRSGEVKTISLEVKGSPTPPPMTS
ncbi:MAG: hypothetical protein R2688_05385 [Fimbriimonadaceae bacterium]